MKMRPRRKELRIPFIVSAILVVPTILMLGYSISRGTGLSNPTVRNVSLGGTVASSPVAKPGSNTSNTVSDVIENLPLVPGASDVKTEDRAPTVWKGVEFDVQAGVDEILQFYRTQLSAIGWTVESKNRDISSSASQGYFWEDSQDVVPYVRILSVSVTERSNTKSTLVNHVDLSMQRIPILDKTPIFPGAQDVQKKQQAVPTTLPTLNKPSNSLLIGETVINYRVQASRVDVGNFYKETLAEYGWYYGGEAFDNSVNAYIKGSLVFRWGIGGVETVGIGASVTLLAAETTNNGTEVELHLRGTNKYSP